MVVTFITGNLKDRLMKEFILLKHLISIKTSGITPYLRYYDVTKIRIKFDGGCIKQDQATIHGAILNNYIVYE